MSSSGVTEEISLVGSNSHPCTAHHHYVPRRRRLSLIQSARLSLTDDTTDRLTNPVPKQLTDPICYPRGLAVIPSVHLAVQRNQYTCAPRKPGGPAAWNPRSRDARIKLKAARVRQSIARSVRNWKPTADTCASPKSVPTRLRTTATMRCDPSANGDAQVTC